MMNNRLVEFKARIYSITGKSFICPFNTTRDGDIVIALYPLHAVDPSNLYAFVIDTDGITQSVSRRFLKREKDVILTYEKKWIMTAQMAKSAMINAMVAFMHGLKSLANAEKELQFCKPLCTKKPATCPVKFCFNMCLYDKHTIETEAMTAARVNQGYGPHLPAPEDPK